MPPEVPNDESPEAADSPQPERSGRLAGIPRRFLAWALANRLRTTIVAGAVVGSIGGAIVLSIVLFSRKAEAPSVNLDMVFEALDKGTYAEARQMAERLRDEGGLPTRNRGELAFVLGVVAVHEADNTWSTDKTNYYLLASRYLEESRGRGFPAGRGPEGLFYLGKSLCLSGQLQAGRDFLGEALEANPERKTEIRRLLADAYRNDANSKSAEALQQNKLYLGDPQLSPEERHEGLLQQAQILLQAGRSAECLQTLDKIPANAGNQADAMVLRGQVILEEARALKKAAAKSQQDKAPEKYQAAIKILRQAQSRDTAQTQATRKSMYLIGLCFLETAEYRAALAQFVRTRSSFSDTLEGQAASFQEAELQQQSGRDAEALASYRRALGPISDPDRYHNPWLPLHTLQSRMLSAYRHYLDGQNYETCLKLTQILSPLFARVRIAELQAELERAWGRHLLAQAEHQAPSQAEPLARQGREHLRKAGRAFAELAKLRAATRQYPDDLWESAVSYLDGQDYRHAARLFPEYLNAEARRRQSQALVNLGEALLALGRVDEALASFQECIDLYPRDPASFRARLLASDACVEQGDVQQAESLLRENLSGDLLTPASKEWRDSLFALGRLLHGSQRYEEAIRRLEEAVQRYPGLPQAIEGRYLMADSYRRSGEEAREKLKKDLVESARAARSKKVRETLNAALAQYKQVQDLLNRRQEEAALVPLEKAMLRNCYFSLGDVLFELEQYEAAVKAYSLAASRYQNAPEVLEAYLQMARAYQRMSKPSEARSVLEQAKGVLGRMKADAPFSETTNHSREEWAQLLAQTSVL